LTSNHDKRPRLLILPTATELEWPIKPRLEEWADVAVVEGAQPRDEDTVELAVEELERQGWPSAVVVSDEWAIVKAVALCAARPDLVEALVIGHACLQLAVDGDRPTLNGEVADAFERMLHTDYRMFARAMTQVTQGAYDDSMVQRFVERVPHADQVAFMDRVRAGRGSSFEAVFRRLGVPMLFVRHSGCLLWTEAGFQDAVAAFPDAQTASVPDKPSVSAEFAEELRQFCASLAA
jgi:hypothetical protein